MGGNNHTTVPSGDRVSPTDKDSRPPAPLADVSPSPLIHILLPSKERFGPRNAGAVSGVVHDLISTSQTPGCFHVFGHPVDQPFNDVPFTGIAPRRAWLHGSNIGLTKAYLHYLNDQPNPSLIEVHGRCHVATHIAAARPDVPVALYLHNDPREMKGARSIHDRNSLLHSMSAIICISDYIRGCFLDGLDAAASLEARVQTARNGVERWLPAPVAKSKTILLVGRVVPEKGILECAKALVTVLANKPDWRVVIAGARRFENAEMGSYERAVSQALAPLGDRALMTGFLEQPDIRKLQQEAEIIACPSMWQEPMGKTVLEALAAGAALLTTRRGGIPEAAEGRAHIVDNPGVETFIAALERLVTDDAYRTALQEVAWQDFPFTAARMADDADTLRAAAIQKLPEIANRPR